MRIIFILILLSGCISLVKGQSAPLYPNAFSGYFFNPYIVNPSYVPEQGNVSIAAYYRFRSGFFSDINSFLFSAEKIVRTKKGANHAIRLNIYNDREGPYISKPKAYLNYALKLPISSNSALFAGIALGVSSISFTAPSGAGSIILPDGNLGVGLKLHQVRMGLSSGQIFNSEGTIISSALKLERYYNVDFSIKQQLSAFWTINGYFYWRDFSGIPDEFSFSGSLEYNESLQFGGIYKWKQGISWLASVQINKEGNPLFISFIYNSAFLSTIPLWNDSYEIGIKYGIK